MAHNPATPPVNSLKGKIWLATTALGVGVTAFGLIAYFVQSFLTKDAFYAVFAPFLILAVLVMIFGWRFAEEVSAPVERVSLLAKSFERGLTTSLPKTTGAADTDELLQTVHRLSRQTKKVVEAMEAAAGGNPDAALAIDFGSDKTSQAFQKLLAKVSESIRAKRDLDKLRGAIAKLAEDVAGVRRGDLSAEAETNEAAAQDLARTLNFLIARLGETCAQIQTDGARAHSLADEARKTLESAARGDENKARELNQVLITLQQVPQSARKIAADLSESATRAEQAADKARRGTQTARENLESVGALRRRIQETARRTNRLREHSREMAGVAKTIEDLARRATLVALNASIQSSESGAAAGSFAEVSGEIERLAARAGETGEAIASLNKSIQSDINEVESSLESTFGDAASLSKFAIETGDALGELERYVGQFLSLQNGLADYAGSQSEEAEKSFRVFADAVAETAAELPRLKEGVQNLHDAAVLLEDLRETAAEFKIPAPAADPETAAPDESSADFVEFQLTADPPFSV